MPDPPKSAAELLERYKRGERAFVHLNLSEVDLSDTNLSDIDFRDADLRRANLSHCDLRGASLSHSDLSEANLSSVDLYQATLIGASLHRADLHRAALIGATLSDANLSDANLSGADLSYADLSGAELSGADLRRAQFGGTALSNLDLSPVYGLDTAMHGGPSTVGIDTIYKSKGKIPESFLRGCGVPDSFITYMPSLVGQPFEFYSCFISYSSKDEEFAKCLYARLQQDHLRVWFAPEEMKGGRKLHEQIDEAIRLYDKLLLILSAASMSSLWVQREILKARQKEEREKRRVLFPLRLCSFDELRDWECLDSDTGLDLAREVRSYFIPDFSAWKDHDAFEASATRLLNDLRA